MYLIIKNNRTILDHYKYRLYSFMKIRLLHTLGILTLLISNLTFSQESKLQIKGEQFLKKEKHTEAIEYFSTLDSATWAKEPLYNYYYGMAFYYSPNKKS